MKRELSSLEIIEISERAQHAILGALMHSRRWKKGEIAFQGGTCLHLMHGAPRFSQDLDFMVASDKGLDAAMEKAAAAAFVALGAGPDWVCRVKKRGDGESDQRNPRMYNITLQSPQWVRSIKIKAEFFVTDQGSMNAYETTAIFTHAMLPAKTEMAKSLRPQTPTMVDTAKLNELVADKVFAVAARPMLKARDWFDLWWIEQKMPGANAHQMAEMALKGWSLREKIYHSEKTCEQFIELMLGRVNEFENNIELMAEDVRQWILATPLADGDISKIVRQALILVKDIAVTMKEKIK